MEEQGGGAVAHERADMGEEAEERRAEVAGALQSALGPVQRFANEGKVRDLLRKALKRRVYWIENRRGGTHGMPDAVVGTSRGALFIELKVGVIGEGCIRFRADAKQPLVGRQMIEAGLDVAWLIAEKGGRRLLWTGPHEVGKDEEKKSLDSFISRSWKEGLEIRLPNINDLRGSRVV